ncbi:MAG: type I-MYXAN CRISPR-associated protein Cas6/Cmx6 [Chloracidobacterium sp.]
MGQKVQAQHPNHNTLEGHNMLKTVELCFFVSGDWLPVDHGYHLYAAVARHLEWVHDNPDIGIAPLRGIYGGNGKLLLQPWSRLIIRTPTEKLPALLKLAGRQLDVDGRRLRVSIPTVHSLVSAPVLYAHLVTTKNGDDETRFDAEITRQLSQINVAGRVERGVRRTLSVHGRRIVGYSLTISQLSEEGAVILQAVGLGGRRRMGCGIFFARKESELR